MARHAAIGLLKRERVLSLATPAIHTPGAQPGAGWPPPYAARRFLAREAGLRRAAVLRAGFLAVLRAVDFFFIALAIVISPSRMGPNHFDHRKIMSKFAHFVDR